VGSRDVYFLHNRIASPENNRWIKTHKEVDLSQAWWFTPIIPATWESEIGISLGLRLTQAKNKPGLVAQTCNCRDMGSIDRRIEV
jgi:hypothetical protein